MAKARDGRPKASHNQESLSHTLDGLRSSGPPGTGVETGTDSQQEAVVVGDP